MNPKLEELLINRLSGQSSQAPSLQDQMSNMYKQMIEKDQIKSFEEQFMATLHKSQLGVNQDGEKYEASLKSIFNKQRLIRAAGISMSTSVSSLIPINISGLGLGVRGTSQMLAGFIAQKLAKGKGSFSHFAEGVFDAGLALAVGGFIPSNVLGNLNLGSVLQPPANNGASNNGNFVE